MRSRFDEQLSELNKELTQMGALCEEIIESAAKALTEKDTTAISKIPALEEEINHMERSIESLCLKLLLQQQPVARDLRQISAALKMITDMERIGDQAFDIGEIIPKLNGRSGEECDDIRKMALFTSRMVMESIEAYVRNDVNIAKATMLHDDVVDDCFARVKHSLIKIITKNPEDGGYALNLLMIAKYFERIGDHAGNISEWVIFSATGKHKGELEL